METPATKKMQQPQLPFKTAAPAMMDQQQGLDILAGDSIYNIYDDEGNLCDPVHVLECLDPTEEQLHDNCQTHEAKESTVNGPNNDDASSVSSASDDGNENR